MKRIALAATLASAVALQSAWAQEDRVWVDGELSYGLDVVPPDVVDTSPEQDRIRSGFDGEIGVNYDLGPAIVRASAGARIFPSESDYNRYPLAIAARYDVPLTSDNRTRLRFQPSYEYVFGNDGRVFDRPRLDTQLIHRHNPEHTTTLRLRYGYRNQTERRFSGYDQSEWLGEVRHFWRPNGGPTRITGSLLGLRADADDDRFSYNGYGAQLIARTDLRDDLQAYGRVYFAHRDYKAPFSSLYPYDRSDNTLRVTAGLEKRLNERFSLFGEAGYARNNSNVPTRQYDGFVGRIGIILR
ncbi:hypothetical protein CNR27_12625 [Luteimonas chenhongjianii]|uniref:DUF560 domain-containing protein n=1 Tax=Luteimonas chenhongjianii TaxID=2006110 RepID=A0A290XGI1_9GAMM|nr:outer membrane beta-barrel protein [Luteimonas chenhongjianii]ATD68173.1 hypothetical protein CNR27_12625 [Luteimonas chenhongjianii]